MDTSNLQMTKIIIGIAGAVTGSAWIRGKSKSATTKRLITAALAGYVFYTAADKIIRPK